MWVLVVLGFINALSLFHLQEAIVISDSDETAETDEEPTASPVNHVIKLLNVHYEICTKVFC